LASVVSVGFIICFAMFCEDMFPVGTFSIGMLLFLLMISAFSVGTMLLFLIPTLVVSTPVSCSVHSHNL